MLRGVLIFIFLAGVIFSCNWPLKNPDESGQRLIEVFNQSHDDNLATSNPDSALLLAKNVLNLNPEAGSPQIRINAGIQAGNVYYYKNEPDSAWKFYREAYRLTIENNLTQQESRLLQLMANIEIDRQNYQKATELLSSAVKINSEIGHREQMAANFSSLGIIHDDNYSYDSAIYFYHKALIIFDSVDDLNNKAIILGNLGGVYNTMEQFEKSAKFHQQAILLLDSLNNQQQLIISYNKLGNALQNLQQYDSALLYFRRSHDLAQDYGDDFSALIAKFNTGKVLSKMKRYLEGEQIIREIDAYCTENEIVDGRLRCMLLLGQNYLAQKKYSDAIALFREGLKIAEENDYPYFQQEFLEGLIMINDLTSGNNELSSWHEKLNNVAAQIGEKEMKERIAGLEAKYALAEKDKILLKLTTEKQILSLRNKLFASIAALLVIAIVTTVFIFRSRNRVLAQKHQLAEEALQRQRLLLEKSVLESRLKDEEIRNRELVIKQKDNELVYNALSRAKSIEFFHRLKDRIIPFQNKFKMRKDQLDFFSVIQEMEAANNQEAMSQFEKIFRELHPGFFENLSKKYPDITGRELQLCAMLRLNMNSKDIASVTFLASTTIDTARYRIRKKMNLDSDASLTVELLKF